MFLNVQNLNNKLMNNIYNINNYDTETEDLSGIYRQPRQVQHR